MSILLDRRNDGSLAFFLDGELQFDSQDERIYHEALALPTLAVAEARNQGPIGVLVIGGGDGLTARELLKSSRVTRIDLVDYDPKVIELARTEFSQFNNDSLSDARVHVSIEDARIFIARAIEVGTKYDVIISDLTASHDLDSAQLHTIEFYNYLRQILSENGTLAVNAASPSGTPEAYWSIYNSMLASSLNPRAYRIDLPSFAAQGYGVDWGFILASPMLINSGDIGNHLALVEPRLEMKDGEHIRNLFYLPEEVVSRQAEASAGCGGSDVLVHYLFNARPVLSESSTLVDTLSINLSELTAPQQCGSYLLTQELQLTFASWQEDPAQQEAVIAEVFELMPALRQFQTREMIADFMAKPAAFLAPIDLGALVTALLNRASELPEKLIEELRLLKEKIAEFAEDHDRLLALGSRLYAVIAVVVIIGNLMFPDAVYAKGHAEHHASAHHDAHHDAHHVDGHRGGRGYVGGGGVYYGNGPGHWGPWFINSNGKRVRNWIR